MTAVRSSGTPDKDGGDGAGARRDALETDWLTLTRRTLPALALARNWPVSADHCFQRILLDNAVGGRWYDRITGRPAYRHADAATLKRAIDLARAVVASEVDLAFLNARSLDWRGKPRR